MNSFRKIYQHSHNTSDGLLRLLPDVHRDEGWINPWRHHYLALVISALTFWWLVSGALAQTPPYPSCVNYSGLKDTTCALYASAIDPEGDPIYYIYSWGDGTADTRVPSSGTVASGTEVYANHTWTSAGQFTVRVFAYDEAGHQSTASDPTVVTITADTTGPTLNYVPSGSSGWQTSATAITLSATDAQGVLEARYNWDAAASATTGTVYVNGAIINSPAGSHTLYLWAKDTLNNTSVKGPSLAYQYDDTNPSNPGQATCTPSPNNTGAHTCTFTASTDTQSGVALYYVYESLDGGAMQLASPATTAINSWTPSPALAAGTYQYQIIAQDSAGRTSGASSPSSNVIVDKTNPSAASCVPGSGTYGSAQSVSCSATDAGSPVTTVTVRYTSGATTPPDPTCASPAFTSPTSISTTTVLKVMACDGAGNQSAVTTESYAIIINTPPSVTYNPTPASDFYAPFDINSLSLTWSGGDTDSILYKVYISPDAAIEPSDYDGSITVLGGTDYIVYGGPQTKILNPNTKYYWQVTADDTPLGQPTYPGRPVAGPIWNFTMNSVPVVNGGSINPVVIDKQGTITWQSQDSNNDQNLTFDIYYNTVPGSLVGATKINSMPLAANAVCSGISNSSGWSCSFVWDSSCVPAAANLYLVIKAMDGYDATIHYNAGSFTIDHTQAKQFPSSGFGTANNDEVVNMQVDDGSVDYSKTPPQVKFRGACLNPKTINPSLQANSALPAASHNGSLNQGEESPYYNLVGLNSGANQLKFTTTNNSCHKTDYQISYNLVTSCGQPYVAVQSGEIYSQGNVRSEYAPPTGNFNASYLILGGGSDAQPKVIENFVAPVADYLKPNFGVVPYPTTTTSDQPQIGVFDYYSLTHKAGGAVVADGDTNLYGYQVKVWGSAGSTTSSSLTIGQGGHNQLDNQVYYFKGNLTIDDSLMFRNGSGNKSAAGLIIIDGDLNINNNLSYEVGSYEGSIRNLASVGWMIGGQVAVGGSVGQLVGTFYVAGSSGSGNFNTGSGSGQLNIYGSIIAKQISFNRTFSAPGEPSEKVIMDGRIMINTPPGFTDLLSTLPAWRFRTP
ncbi:MAG: chitobiase/beta-hexosaminidase C-terminal domain-containing protein [Candidatus Kerfeldbacteria bacterium]|nr:chitobiase/beta-hexosaminidase C-terminal domain-containing protein [Candidatus Kerfeldbacteria bacterium]